MNAPAAVAATPAIEPRLLTILERVSDPEIPVLSVVDLGIVRYAQLAPDRSVRVGLSPTYSGCPATAVIKEDVERALHEAGYERVQLADVLSPPWTSDWISEAGRRKLLAYGIAPPAHRVSSLREVLRPDAAIACPRCGSGETEKLSEFGSTPCKALHRCTACLEPFDYFKCI